MRAGPSCGYSAICSSAALAIAAIMLTDSTGYCPAAVSADSITASAPSNTAPATSEASARVGEGAFIMLSSICVATITGLPTRRHFATRFFWIDGTSGAGSSTPKSPRATITASVAEIISSISFSAIGFSILAMICACLPISVLASITSFARCTKDSAMKSTPSFRAKAKSSLSLLVSGVISSVVSGRLTPFLLEILPLLSVLAIKMPSFTEVTVRPSLPSSIKSRAFGIIAAKISSCGRGITA